MIFVRQTLSEINPKAPLYDGLDSALVGIAQRCGMEPTAVYDYDLLVKELRLQGMTEDEAMDWIDIQILGSWCGPLSPIILSMPKPEYFG